MENDYFKQRNNENLQRIRGILRELPSFCEEYFVGIETQTTVLTRLNYAYDLRLFFEYLAFHSGKFNVVSIDEFTKSDLRLVTSTQIEQFISYLSYYTINGKEYINDNTGKARKLSSVRAFFKYFYNKGVLDSDVAAKVAVPRIKDKEIIRLEIDEVIKLLNSVEDDNTYAEGDRRKAFQQLTKKRDIALLTLFLGTGIRISECVGLNVDDIDFNINGFTVTRKGGKRAVLYFSDEVADALMPYMEDRISRKDIPEDEHALFLSLQRRRISLRAVENLVKKYAKIIAPLKKISPHKLRSTYGTNLYRETGDIYVVAEVLGHSDINTTKKHYAALGDDIKRDAARRVVLREKK